MRKLMVISVLLFVLLANSCDTNLATKEDVSGLWYFSEVVSGVTIREDLLLSPDKNFVLVYSEDNKRIDEFCQKGEYKVDISKSEDIYQITFVPSDEMQEVIGREFILRDKGLILELVYFEKDNAEGSKSKKYTRMELNDEIAKKMY